MGYFIPSWFFVCNVSSSICACFWFILSCSNSVSHNILFFISSICSWYQEIVSCFFCSRLYTSCLNCFSISIQLFCWIVCCCDSTCDCNWREDTVAITAQPKTTNHQHVSTKFFPDNFIHYIHKRIKSIVLSGYSPPRESSRNFIFAILLNW